jgi:hypothetical protein
MTRAGAGYLDRKFVYIGGVADGWLTLRFTTAATAKGGGLLIICEPTTSWHRTPNMLALTAMEYKIDATPVVVIRKVCEYDGGSGQCFLISDPTAPGGAKAKPGPHVLAVRVKPGTAATASGACVGAVCLCVCARARAPLSLTACLLLTPILSSLYSLFSAMVSHLVWT